MHFKIAKSAQSYFNNIMNLEGSHAAEDKNKFIQFDVYYCCALIGMAAGQIDEDTSELKDLVERYPVQYRDCKAQIAVSYTHLDVYKRQGLLEIDMTASFLINDGQHRKAAIEAAIAEDESLKEETISIVLYKDQGLQRSQQMFTDLNKHAVTTSKSLNTLYESKDPVALITKNVVNSISFLRKYTDRCV